MQVVVEFEGVVVEDTSDVHSKAWVQLADDEGKSRPLQFALKRAEGMKNDQVHIQSYSPVTLFSSAYNQLALLCSCDMSACFSSFCQLEHKGCFSCLIVMSLSPLIMHSRVLCR